MVGPKSVLRGKPYQAWPIPCCLVYCTADALHMPSVGGASVEHLMNGEDTMSSQELADKPAPIDQLVNFPRLISAYYTRTPQPDDPTHQVAFGTSGHRGSS